MAKRIGRKRLSIDIPIKLHESIFLIAYKRKITLTKYVIRALIEYSKHEILYNPTIKKEE